MSARIAFVTELLLKSGLREIRKNIVWAEYQLRLIPQESESLTTKLLVEPVSVSFLESSLPLEKDHKDHSEMKASMEATSQVAHPLTKKNPSKTKVNLETTPQVVHPTAKDNKELLKLGLKRFENGKFVKFYEFLNFMFTHLVRLLQGQPSTSSLEALLEKLEQFEKEVLEGNQLPLWNEKTDALFQTVVKDEHSSLKQVPVQGKTARKGFQLPRFKQKYQSAIKSIEDLSTLCKELTLHVNHSIFVELYKNVRKKQKAGVKKIQDLKQCFTGEAAFVDRMTKMVRNCGEESVDQWLNLLETDIAYVITASAEIDKITGNWRRVRYVNQLLSSVLVYMPWGICHGDIEAWHETYQKQAVLSPSSFDLRKAHPDIYAALISTSLENKAYTYQLRFLSGFLPRTFVQKENEPFDKFARQALEEAVEIKGKAERAQTILWFDGQDKGKRITHCFGLIAQQITIDHPKKGFYFFRLRDSGGGEFEFENTEAMKRFFVEYSRIQGYDEKYTGYYVETYQSPVLEKTLDPTDLKRSQVSPKVQT